jgi:hypothetical protein
VFCVGISPTGATEADAPPTNDNAPATPNAVTAALFRPLVLEVCFERDTASYLRMVLKPLKAVTRFRSPRFLKKSL